jgi:hypothetical protein
MICPSRIFPQEDQQRNQCSLEAGITEILIIKKQFMNNFELVISCLFSLFSGNVPR